MDTATPLPAELVDIGLGTLVLILGIFIVVVGIIIAGVVYRESREWKKMVLPMFDRDSTETGPESPAEPNGLTPRMAAYGKEIFGRALHSYGRRWLARRRRYRHFGHTCSLRRTQDWKLA